VGFTKNVKAKQKSDPHRMKPSLLLSLLFLLPFGVIVSTIVAVIAVIAVVLVAPVAIALASIAATLAVETPDDPYKGRIP
jgi:hypothetical protein